MEHHLLFVAVQFENMVHFYFVRTLTLVDTIFLLKFDMHFARNRNMLTKYADKKVTYQKHFIGS